MLLLEVKVEGETPKGHPIRTWTDYIIAWTGIAKYEKVKRTAEDRIRWKLMTVDLLSEDDT